MPTESTFLKAKIASATDKVQKYPAEVDKPRTETIDKYLEERTLSLKEHTTGFTAATGELVKCTKTLTVALPAPALNATIAVFNAPAVSTEVTTITAGANKIFGDFINGESSIKLTQNQHVELRSDGSNWFINDGEAKREQAYAAPVARASGEELEPSATRETLVKIICPLKEGTAVVSVGGKTVGEWSGVTIFTDSFICPAGVKWKVTGSFIGASFNSVYLTR